MNWNRLLMKFVIYLSIYLGSTLLRIDFERRQLIPANLFLKFYVVVGNLSFGTWMPYTVFYTSQQSQLFVKNPVARYANFLNLVMRLVIIFVHTLERIQRDKKLSRWLEAIMDIQCSYFDRLRDLPKNTGHRKWLYLSGAVAFVHIGSVAVDIYKLAFINQFLKAIELYPLLGMIAFQHLFMLQHAILLCYLRECLSQINYQLLANYQDPKMSLIYSQLRSKLLQLNEIYGPTVLCILLCLIISNSIVGFVVLMRILLSGPKLHNYDYLFGDSFYLCILVHMYFYFMICEWVMATMKESQAILYKYNTTQLRKEEEQELEKLTLSCCLTGRDINILGMVPINLATLFSIIAQTVLYAIILIQAEYGSFKIKANLN
ncbi:putative gustatory receptor 22a [Musca autumnalis]|uniref:putative gustatory receptor 22a n=1 Tax=Musca autumnalis TaxID=221902 RepID=UPI003CF43B57